MKREKKKNLKLNIFNELNFRLSLLIGHIIWFDKYKDAEFINWNNNIESFTDIKFIIYTSQFYESKEITLEEAVYKLEKLIKKYDLENYSMLPDSQKEAIYKMFNVLSIEYNDIFNLLIRIDSIKMLVNLDKFIDYENWDSLKLYLKSSYYQLSHKEKKYGLGIELILTSAKIIRDCGNYNNIRIDLNEGYIDLTTLPNQ